MILIANREEEIFRQLDGRITSRLKSAPKIRFDQYSLTELVSIRSDRVKWGFRSDAIDDDGLRRIADLAAGDARVAIIRQSALTARQQSRDEITTDAIEDAAPVAKQAIRQRNEEKLTPHQEVLYEDIDTRGEVAPGDLYQEYADRVEEPKTKRGVRNDPQKLIRYDLIAAERENRGRRYHPPEPEQ